ncbi:hypothetical protein EVG20_g1656 [Dentipellis fragilis]|uniref:Carbohydrate kinase FGGY N-terminal domain-containing protein n=1 Tax=Dentipellis fragilis TaxID=205917 RepID=A0A4Y9ZBZ6_9AGAM|nr:hypothetical protein EVG20_g1656 [Dentipellis fragilis]
MPAPAKSGQALFLGLELATDQLRASIVDENLELVGVEAVDFDTELSEYQTQGGIFTTPGDAYTTPVDILLSSGGNPLQYPPFPPSTPASRCTPRSRPAHSLSRTRPLHKTLFHTPMPSRSRPLSAAPDHMAARVGTSAHASLMAAQLLRVREASPDVWARTGRVQVASAFLASLIAGSWVTMSEAEACATGMWVYAAGGQGHWDDDVLDFVGGSREEGRRVRAWLGEVDVSGGGRRIGSVSRYLVERYGFEPDTIVAPFTSDFLSTYLSLCPAPSDAVLAFGPMDILLTSAPHYLPTRLYNVYPHPAQDPSEKRKYIVVLNSRNADVPRALVRDMYTKSWSAFDRLVSVVPPGGSIGLDDKLFSFWLLQGDSFPLSHVKGIFRFETGIKVNEFRDLRANPRCLVESQALSFRVRWSRMVATGILGGSSGRARAPISSTQRARPRLPCQARNQAAQARRCPSPPWQQQLSGCPSTHSAQVAPHRNSPATGFPGRAALGGAYIARFEEEVRRLLGKRWMASGGTALRTNINAPAFVPAAPGTASSGASTPYGHAGMRTGGFGTTVFAEEDEDALEEMERMGMGGEGAVNSSYGFGEEEAVAGRVRTVTSNSASTTGTSSSSSVQPSTAFTTPDLGNSTPGVGVAAENGTADAVTTPATLMPVTALPTSEAEMQVGLGKVAEPDVDAFMAYAAIVPEYCRLEGMLVKALV